MMENLFRQVRLVREGLKIARYVDEVDSEKLIDKAINNILEELDPHSNYIPASQLARVNDELEGNFDGVGIEFIILDDTIVVVSPIVGGPSEEAGILAGDKIVEINEPFSIHLIVYTQL